MPQRLHVPKPCTDSFTSCQCLNGHLRNVAEAEEVSFPVGVGAPSGSQEEQHQEGLPERIPHSQVLLCHTKSSKGEHVHSPFTYQALDKIRSL